MLTFPQIVSERVPGRQGWLLLLCAVVLAGAAGCGTSSSTRAGSISVTDPSGILAGQLTSLSIGNTAKVSMTPINDPKNAGVDWTVTCGGSPFNGSVSGGACGTFAPQHTSNGAAAIYTAPSATPLDTTVTLIASVTGDPSASSTATLPIVALPVTVAFVSPPTSMAAGAAVNLTANALNDTTGAGVVFTASCSINPCGSFSNIGDTTATYTAPNPAPNPAKVTINATSKTYPEISSSITVAITTVSSGAISMTVTPATFYAMPSGGTHSTILTATVTGDATGAGVTWSLPTSCGGSSCGALVNPSPAGNVSTVTYQSPSSVPGNGGVVTITATPNNPSAPASSAGTVTATITTSQVTLIKMTTSPPASLAEGGSATLVATATPTGPMINWSCSPQGSCGTFTNSTGQPTSQTKSGGSITYNAPSTVPSSNGVVTITAASAGTGLSDPAIANVTITPPAPTVTFTQEPSTTLMATGQTQVSASVTNAPEGVTWTVLPTCGSTVAGGCGSIQPYQTAKNGDLATYTGPPIPPGGTVTIIATSTSSGATQNSTAITITPLTTLSVNFVPSLPSRLSSYAVVNLNAAVSNDQTNAGVDWQVCASGCGFFTTVAAVPAIPATPTTPFIPEVPAVTATTVQGWPNGLPISYTAPLATSQGQSMTVTAAAHASPATSTAGTIEIVNSLTGPALNGVVQAGSLPVVGAAVALYAAGTSGFGSASTLVYSPGGSSYATTDSNGSFTIAAGYTCPNVDSQVYLVATGGKVGVNAANPNLALMTALGSCSTLGSGSVVVNEVTTVASVWSVAPFAANDPLSGNSSYRNLGSSSSNTAGLANAFASVNNLVNISTGQARYTTPAGNAVVPYAEINTLADILNACTSTAGGAFHDGTACGTLFWYTAPLGIGGPYNYSAPADTLQGAFNIAQHPAGGLGYDSLQATALSSLKSLNSPFQPTLTSQPSDWSISLNFSGVGGLTGSSGANFLAIDSSGNLWITDTSANNVVEWNTLGAAISPATGFSAGGILSPGPLAIDSSGNIWISGSNGLTELYPTGTPAEGSPFSGGGNGAGMALDGLSNLWITNGAGVMEFNNVGMELSPSSGYVNNGVAATGPIAIDNSNNAWIGNYTSPNSFLLADISVTSGQLVINTDTGNEDTQQTQIAVDGSGNVWVPDGTPSSLCKMPAYGGVGTLVVPTCYTGGSLNGGVALSSIYKPRGIALDGAGNLWIGNMGGNGLAPNLSMVSPSLIGNLSEAFAGYDSTSLSAGPLMVAVDGSGNVWVLLANNTITEYVGIATPAVTPIGLAVKNKKLGKTP